VNHGFTEVTFAGLRFFGFGHAIESTGTPARVQRPNGDTIEG
jgi:hypothetical protein